MTMQPMAGFSALLLVPVVLLMFSIIRVNAFVDRYMITALLGCTPLVAMIASRSSRWLQLAVLAFVIVLSGSTVRNFGAAMTNWQTAEDEMLNEYTTMASDGLPVVSLTLLEAYIVYEYAPNLRKQLFIVDLRPTHRTDLSEIVLNAYSVSMRWQAVRPDLPKLVTLDELAQMGNFHLVLKKEFPILKQGTLPFQTVGGLGWNGLFRVDPRYQAGSR